MLGRDLFDWLVALRLMRVTTDSRIGRRMSEREALVGSSPRGARRLGIQLRPRAVSASGAAVTFEDGSRVEPAVVIWATGFALDHAWIDAPVFDERGAVVQDRGVTSVPGLSFLGLPWMRTRGSALLGWVGDDAEHLADVATAWAAG
jgi:putative flavoprotein involved in K+ transport